MLILFYCLIFRLISLPAGGRIFLRWLWCRRQCFSCRRAARRSRRAPRTDGGQTGGAKIGHAGGGARLCAAILSPLLCDVQSKKAEKVSFSIFCYNKELSRCTMEASSESTGEQDRTWHIAHKNAPVSSLKAFEEGNYRNTNEYLYCKVVSRVTCSFFSLFAEGRGIFYSPLTTIMLCLPSIT